MRECGEDYTIKTRSRAAFSMYNAIMENDGIVGRMMSRVKRYAWILWLLILFISNKTIDVFGDYFAIIRREIELFVGSALVLIGVFGFNAGRMCDGNTADYLSCTRPSAYHYYSGFDIALVVIGAFLILLWFVGRTPAKK
jgi:uncharacterized membrane protein